MSTKPTMRERYEQLRVLNKQYEELERSFINDALSQTKTNLSRVWGEELVFDSPNSSHLIIRFEDQGGVDHIRIHWSRFDETPEEREAREVQERQELRRQTIQLYEREIQSLKERIVGVEYSKARLALMERELEGIKKADP